MFIANLGCIEMNPGIRQVGGLDNPDYLILDIDPSENSYDQVVNTALVIKEILDKLKLTGYCKTSGRPGCMYIFPAEKIYL